MDKVKILITSVSFYPRISPRSFRTTELAKELARMGHEVTVLTYNRGFDYTEFSKTYNLRIEDFVNGKYKEIEGNNIINKATRFLLKYFLIYPDIKFTFLLKKALRNKKGYDLLISIAIPYPVHWGVALAKKNNPDLCKTWVADCGDPFMGNKENKFAYPFYFRFIEAWFCKKADFITVPITEAIAAYPSFCRHKIKVIPQGFSFQSKYSSNKETKNDYPIFAYAGALSKGIRDPTQFLDYLCKHYDRKFKFFLYTTSRSVVAPYIEKLGDKLEIRDYIPREQLLVELEKVDFLVNIENRENIQSPSKLIDYALTNKPILSIKPNALNENIVSEFLNGDYKNKLVINNIEQYNIINVAKKFLNLLNK